jgi:serine/threonine-protein kinase
VSSAAVPALGRLGRYVLEKPLGRGGMAEVFLAKQEGPSGFSKRVVLKRIHRSLLGDDRYVQMFLREARIAARLNHTNLVQVFELGEQNDEYFLAMEHIEGLTLQKAARRAWSAGESVPMEVALRAVADAARGLHYAHTLRDDDGNDISLVHRDISPDNLMLTGDGVTKVLDFGVAKSHDGDPMTTDGELKGKIPYMSPEQIRGDTLDGRSDLWSLGVTLYWLLTGERPFPSHNDLASLHAIVNADPRPPRDLNPLIPMALQTLVLQLLTKDRDRRVATGAELSDRLLTLLGPAAAGGESAEFSRHVLALPDANGTNARTETLAAARPHTEWLTAAFEALGQANGVAVAPPTPLASPALPSPVLPVSIVSRPHTGASDKPESDPLPGDGRPPRHIEPPATDTRARQRLGVGVGLGAVAMLAIAALATPRPEAPLAAVTPQTDVSGQPPAAPVTTAPTTASDPTMPSDTSTTAATSLQPKSTAAAAPTTATTTAPTTAPTTATTTAPTTPSAAPRMTVAVKAPASVRWETERGAKLGAGSTSLALAAGQTRIVARDGARGGRVVVDVTPGATVDWEALPRGRLDVRVEPYADVLLGAEKLGTTPLSPLAVIAGTYQVTLVYEDQRVEKVVDVAAGRDTRVTHRF